MKKRSTAKTFILILSLLIILPIAFLLTVGIVPKYSTIGLAHDTSFIVKTPTFFHPAPDSTIVPAPDPGKLYPVGKTPKTIYDLASSMTTSSKGYTIVEHMNVDDGPVIYLKIDKPTKAIYPYNFIDRYTNFVYLTGTRNVRLYFYAPFKTLSEYRYRILMGDSVCIPWQQPQDSIRLSNLFSEPADSTIRITDGNIAAPVGDKSGLTDTVLLADLNIYGKKITLELYNINNPKGATTLIIYAKPIDKPKISRIRVNLQHSDGSSSESFPLNYTSALKAFFSKLPKPEIHINELDQLSIQLRQAIATKFYTVSIKNTSTFLSKTYEIPPNEQAQDYRYDAAPQRIVWPVNDPAKFIHKPGIYQVTVTPKLPRYYLKFPDSAASVRFAVLPPTEGATSYTIWQILPFVWILLLILLLLFLWYRSRQKRKLRQLELQSKIAREQLNGIRLQLNPHFVFNALSGIQNLMNKKDIDKANRYLGKFSRLTRSVLDEEYKESIPIADELKLLDDYLQMEQLRFGFQYLIQADPEIDTENTEIPAMLLQPLVENAVKYGVYEKGAEGRIGIKVLMDAKNLTLQITDNGNGFNTKAAYQGLGIRLTRSHIDLLNKLQKSTRIVLDLESDTTGTVATIHLYNWI